MCASFTSNMLRYRQHVEWQHGTQYHGATMRPSYLCWGSRQTFSKVHIVDDESDWIRWKVFGTPFEFQCTDQSDYRTRFAIDNVVCSNVAIRRGREHRRKFYRTTTAGNVERLGFRISQFWNRDPLWFSSLSTEMKSKLIADYRLCHEDPKETKRKNKAARINEFNRRRKRDD